MEKSLSFVDNFFDDALYNECYDYSIEKLTSNEESFNTNRSWPAHLLKDSNLVLIHKLSTDNQLHKRITDTIKSKYQIYNFHDIQFYYWTPGSHIPWHTDIDYNGGITIYLNKSWDENWGGTFLYKDGKSIKGFYPKPNLSIKQCGGIPHSVIPTTNNSDVRFTIQIFF